MITKALSPTLDMIGKMLENKEPHEKIQQFLNQVQPSLYRTALKGDIISCTGCGLHACRHTLFTGSFDSDIMFVGEAPGEQEEKSGQPFVGPAGELFTKMLSALAEKVNERWARENVYITNTIKCRPTDAKKSNRQPEMKEIAACKPTLDNEIRLVNPKIIICVGATAANTLIHPGFKITEEHGRMFGDTCKLVAIYHPSFVLHKGEETEEGLDLKMDMWNDLIAINEYLDSLA